MPRAWTLAWGVMSNQTFADTLPADIAPNFDPPLLHDEATVALPADDLDQLQTETKAIVTELKELLKF